MSHDQNPMSLGVGQGYAESERVLRLKGSSRAIITDFLAQFIISHLSHNVQIALLSIRFDRYLEVRPEMVREYGRSDRTSCKQTTINNLKEKEMTTSSEINVLKSLKKLYEDSRITKNAHDIASERKKAMRYILGISAMVLSVFVATGLVELLASDKSASIIIKLLTFFSAIFAGALTFLNYETEAKTHLSAVGVYANICRSAEFLVAKAKDNLITPEETASRIDALLEQFSKANLDYQNCIPTDKDFDKARQKMKAKDESSRHNIKVKEEPQGTSA